MNIVVVTPIYFEEDCDFMPTKTVNYFVDEWNTMGHNIVVIYCPSKFPKCFYNLPSFISKHIAGRYNLESLPPENIRKEKTYHDNSALVYRMPISKLFPGQKFSNKTISKCVKKIIPFLERNNFCPDVILGHWANPSVALVSELAKKYCVKSSIVFHQDCNQHSVSKYNLLDKIKNIGAVGVRTAVDVEKVKEILQLDEAPFICCSGVPNNLVKATMQKGCRRRDFNDGICHICVASLVETKCVDSVIAAFAKIRQEKDILYIVGQGSENENLQKLVNENRINKQVKFLGQINRSQVLDYMKKANVFTLISKNEAFGMVYIEAMLCGCIVIASKNEGADGIIQDGFNGFLCEAGNAGELVKIYNKITALPAEERDEICRNAIYTAVQYSENAVAKKYLNDVIEHNTKKQLKTMREL